MRPPLLRLPLLLLQRDDPRCCLSLSDFHRYPREDPQQRASWQPLTERRWRRPGSRRGGRW